MNKYFEDYKSVDNIKYVEVDGYHKGDFQLTIEKGKEKILWRMILKNRKSPEFSVNSLREGLRGIR